MATQGALVKASDLSAYLTADTVMDALDIEALKEVLDVGSSGGAKIIGNASDQFTNQSNTLTLTLPTSDFDYLEVKSYPRSDGIFYDSYNTQYMNTHVDMFTPITTFISKNTSSGKIPIKFQKFQYGSSYNEEYISSQVAPYTLSGTTLTFTVPYYTYPSSGTPSYTYSYAGTIDVTQYKY